MNMKFYRKLPIPMEIKERFPASEEIKEARNFSINEIKNILSGKSDKFLLIVGPCSADSEAPVLEYLRRIKRLSDEVKDKIFILPRVYTNKPRTTGEGYKGMLHQPDPNAEPDILKGIVATRQMHIKAIEATGLGCADEMLYPENHRYISDILAYAAVGARSVENQQHRLTASGLDIPVGMKNPTSGDLSVMINAIKAAQSSHVFAYRGWEVKSEGNPYAHAILRGYIDNNGVMQPNYTYEYITRLSDMLNMSDIKNAACIIDTNHANSAKNYMTQIDIAKNVLASMRRSEKVKTLVKGLMIESYLEDGCQKESEIPGMSITDPCLGWDKTLRLIYDIAEMI